MAELAFTLAFPLAAPFWLLMIVFPRWRYTARIVSTPWIAAPAAVIYLLLALPMLGDLLPAVARPDLAGVAELLGGPEGAALGWAHFIAFDLFVGRWIYLDSRKRELSPWPLAPVLVVAILLAPIGFLAYLGLRAVRRPRFGEADAAQPAA